MCIIWREKCVCGAIVQIAETELCSARSGTHVSGNLTTQCVMTRSDRIIHQNCAACKLKNKEDPPKYKDKDPPPPPPPPSYGSATTRRVPPPSYSDQTNTQSTNTQSTNTQSNTNQNTQSNSLKKQQFEIRKISNLTPKKEAKEKLDKYINSRITVTNTYKKTYNKEMGKNINRALKAKEKLNLY